MIEREAIEPEARALIGTPFQHQARLPGIATDCAGVLILIARKLGIVAPDFDVTGYPREADGKTLMQNLEKFLVRISEPTVGDVGVYTWAKHAHHVGVIVPYRHGGFSIIHALGPVSPCKVVESRLLPNMRRIAAFSFPGVA
jgi:cell wall-associated NlpC family hydrolase